MIEKFVSIVVPALNEERTIGEFVDWCRVGLASAGAKGEILIMDSSEDRTAEIAVEHGARVVRVSQRGLGQAYIDALSHIKGEYVIMGDCDLTYDFRQIKPFLLKLDEGYDFVIGTRIRGEMEKGSMPLLHRYFGNPLTTFVLNVIYGSRFSDIHCGMRAMTIDALRKIDLESVSWEYASEMVLKACRNKFRIAEVPILFHKDMEGRLSHHKRSGWMSPWIAGWINLKVMFLYAPDYFLEAPGILAISAGLVLSLVLCAGPVVVFGKTLSLYWLLAGITLTVMGYSALQMALLAKIVCNFSIRQIEKYKKIFSYNKGVVFAVILFGAGLVLLAKFLFYYVENNYTLPMLSNSAIVGLLFLIMGFQTFTFTLLFNLIVKKMTDKSGRK